jgi:phosphoglycerate dehydrogenase-like enzyme
MTQARHTICITSPLELDLVERLRMVDPARVTVLYEPELMPPLRYVCDHGGDPSFKRDADQLARFRAGIARADILFDLPAAADLAFAEKLRWVQTSSTGVGPKVAQLGLDKTDVIITTARGVHAGPLAEFVFMALLAHFRGLHHLAEEQRAHRWTRYCGPGVAGRTLVTIGAGDLARGCARIAKALSMRVVAVARDAAKTRPDGLFDEVLPVPALRQALAMADAVVVTVPHTAETAGMIGAAEFAAMPPGCAFVNIGRGTVVDEPALIDALQHGHIGLAALDVTAIEPLPSDSPLWDMPNVLISPHSASTVASENAAITDIFCDNLRLFLAGRSGEMRNILDKRLLY